MSLIAFHRLLITTAILFYLGFTLRQFTDFRTSGEGAALIMGVISGIAAGMLGFYLWHLRDFLKLR